MTKEDTIKEAIQKMSEPQRNLLCSILNHCAEDGPMASRTTLPYFTPSYVVDCIDKCLDKLTGEGRAMMTGAREIILASA